MALAENALATVRGSARRPRATVAIRENPARAAAPVAISRTAGANVVERERAELLRMALDQRHDPAQALARAGRRARHELAPARRRGIASSAVSAPLRRVPDRSAGAAARTSLRRGVERDAQTRNWPRKNWRSERSTRQAIGSSAVIEADIDARALPCAIGIGSSSSTSNWNRLNSACGLLRLARDRARSGRRRGWSSARLGTSCCAAGTSRRMRAGNGRSRSSATWASTVRGALADQIDVGLRHHHPHHQIVVADDIAEQIAALDEASRQVRRRRRSRSWPAWSATTVELVLALPIGRELARSRCCT